MGMIWNSATKSFVDSNSATGNAIRDSQKGKTTINAGVGATASKIKSNADSLLKNNTITKNEYNNVVSNLGSSKTIDNAINLNNAYNKYSTGGGGGSDDDTTTSTEVADAYWDALIGRLDNMNSARKAYNDAFFANQRNDALGYYSKIGRKMMRSAQTNGQDPYVTNAWNVAYAKDKALRDIDQNELEAKASNYEDDYSKYSSLYNSLINSNASDATKKRLLGYSI